MRRGVARVPGPELSRESAPGGEEAASSGAEIRTDEIAGQLERVLHSPIFCKAPRHCRFLEFAVRKTLSGESGEIKEYLIGLEVFDRTPEFDPRSDPIVRAEARRLRSRLSDYYRDIGKADPIHIE